MLYAKMSVHLGFETILLKIMDKKGDGYDQALWIGHVI